MIRISKFPGQLIPVVKFRSFGESSREENDPQQRRKHDNFLLTSEVNISETVPDRSIVTINHIYELIYDLSFYVVTFDLEPPVRSLLRS